MAKVFTFIAQLVAFAAGIVLLIWMQSGEPKNMCDDEVMAYVIAKKAVKQHLRSPSTSDFPYSNEVSIEGKGGCRFTINGYVDAQNGFGAMIRSYYTVDVEYLAFNDHWNAYEVVIK